MILKILIFDSVCRNKYSKPIEVITIQDINCRKVVKKAVELLRKWR